MKIGRIVPMAITVDSGTARLSTTVYPRPGAQTVILLHGGPGVPMDFAPLVDVLEGSYQVITFEQRGTARSPTNTGSYTIDDYLGDIDAIARRVGVERFHLFGHSWGGLYAQLYLQRNPHRVLSLLLSSPSSGTGPAWVQTEREVMQYNRARTDAWGWSLMGMRTVLGHLGSDTAYQRLFKQVLENYHRPFIPGFIAGDAMVSHVRAEPINRTRAVLRNAPPLDVWPRLPCPVLVSYGEHDVYGESRHLVEQRFPGAAHAEIPAAGHVPWLHNPTGFALVLAQFYQLPASAPPASQARQ